MKKVGILYGSLRKASLSLQIANIMLSLFPEDWEAKILPIDHLPFYNQDIDTQSPPLSYQTFRSDVRKMDAFLFITPEYNRSIPAVLKNALDVASRPFHENAWNKKPAAIISLSPGAIGGFGAAQHLRQILSCLNMPTVQQPEAYLHHADKLFDKAGELINPDMDAFLRKVVQALIQLQTALATKDEGQEEDK